MRVELGLLAGLGREDVPHLEHRRPGGDADRSQDALAPAVRQRRVDDREVEHARRPRPRDGEGPGRRRRAVGGRQRQLAPPERRLVEPVRDRRRDEHEQAFDEALVPVGVAVLGRARGVEDALPHDRVRRDGARPAPAGTEALEHLVVGRGVDDAQAETRDDVGREHRAGARRVAPRGHAVEDQEPTGATGGAAVGERDRDGGERLEHTAVARVRGERVVQLAAALRSAGGRQGLDRVRELDRLDPERARDAEQAARHDDQVRGTERVAHARVRTGVADEDARAVGADPPARVRHRVRHRVGTPGDAVRRGQERRAAQRLGRGVAHEGVDRPAGQAGRHQVQDLDPAGGGDRREQLRVRLPRASRDVLRQRARDDVAARRFERERREQQGGEGRRLVGRRRRVHHATVRAGPLRVVGHRARARQGPRHRPPVPATLLDRPVREQQRVEPPVATHDGPPVAEVRHAPHGPGVVDDDLRERGQGEQHRVAHPGELGAHRRERRVVAQLRLDHGVEPVRDRHRGRERQAQDGQAVAAPRDLRGERGDVADDGVEGGARAREREPDGSVAGADADVVGDGAQRGEPHAEPSDRPAVARAGAVVAGSRARGSTAGGASAVADARIAARDATPAASSGAPVLAARRSHRSPGPDGACRLRSRRPGTPARAAASAAFCASSTTARPR
ncbi:hypothetical protein [Cellulosimicrobium sp. CUA-896]|uniref:hypothetical protein n=1 Tax=Cellulosimicrobium sp. CUA-896 TaxID=1517881 RepID=UPI0011151E9B|nr:hypothetical protein [Cellulosimicrobium sp. CUA-896]